MSVPVYQQPFPKASLPDRIFPPFTIPKTLISRCNVRRGNSFVVRSSSSSSDRRKTLPQSAIQRIAEKLRSLGFVEESHDSSPAATGEEYGKNNSPGEIFVPLPKQLPIHRVGHTIDTSWSTPSYPVPKPGSGTAISRYHELKRVWKKETEIERKKEVKVPSLAELTLPAAELRRLRSEGIRLTKKLKIGKAGITEGIVNGIHERWRTTEVVKIFCEDISRMNMKRTHDVLETKTGGLVIWRSGSKILLYRGVNYQYPYFVSDRDLAHDSSVETASGALSMDQGVVDSREKLSIAESSSLSVVSKTVKPLLIQGVGSPDKVRFQLPGEVQLVEEADQLLEGLGPRYTDWWAYDPLPVDGDLLPGVVPDYRRPFRLLPYGVSPKLTDDEMTTIRRLGRPLPCHFALGRNRNLQGLAVAIVKLWEKCELAKIAVKRGVQNTNSELMAEELKWLTGGTLISRDKDFIVLYRGKDFLPFAVSSAIEERRRQTMIMEKSSTHKMTENEEEIKPQAATDDTELDAEYKKDHLQTHQMKPRQPKSPEEILEKTSIKLSMALEKKAKAEKILAELESRESPQQSDIDKEGITDDEKYMLRKIGLKMKPFLLLGRRGVFDGTIENMHLHWKYRELVKIICNEHSIEAAYEVAEILEAESGGILVAVEIVSKGYAIIVYRGKNYERPPCLRPQTLLSKREALKRSVEAQRRKSLKLHVLKLSNNIDELNRQLVEDSVTNETWSDGESSTRVVQEETENQLIEPEKSREEIELGYSSDLSVSSSGEENWEDDSEGEVDTFTTSSHEHQEDESGSGLSQRHEGNSLDSTANISVLAESGSAKASSFHDRSVPGKSYLNAERKVPKQELGSSGGGSRISAQRERKNENDGLVTDLSNRERLILRKQALKMKKRPPFAVGRSNVVTGLARTLKMHFQKNHLAIVNVKGRAEGTSVQEVIAKLKEETGALLVSQEPSKVILYRGWGAEEEMKSFYPNNNVKNSINLTSSKSFVDDPPPVSPALIEAIRLECGL